MRNLWIAYAGDMPRIPIRLTTNGPVEDVRSVEEPAPSRSRFRAGERVFVNFGGPQATQKLSRSGSVDRTGKRRLHPCPK